MFVSVLRGLSRFGCYVRLRAMNTRESHMERTEMSQRNGVRISSCDSTLKEMCGRGLRLAGGVRNRWQLLAIFCEQEGSGVTQRSSPAVQAAAGQLLACYSRPACIFQSQVHFIPIFH